MKDANSDEHIANQTKQIVDDVLRRMLSTPPQKSKQETNPPKEKNFRVH